MATIGTILIQAANQAGSITGPNAPSSVGVGAGDLKYQKQQTEYAKKNEENNQQAPKFWTAAFKKMGIQMGLAGILKQSQIFTSTVGSLFQIFGAFVDVILAPFVPLFIPAIRWLARQLPTVAKAAQWTADKLSKGVSAVWNFLTNGKMWSNVGNFFKDMASAIWDKISPVLEPIGNVFKTIGEKMYDWILKPIKAGMEWLWNNTLGGWKVGIGSIMGKSLSFRFPTWGSGGAGGQGAPDAPPSNGESNIGEYAKNAALVTAGMIATNLATKSVTPRGLGITDRGKKIPTGQRGSRLTRGGFWGGLDEFELNPLRRIPGMKFLHGATKPAAAAARLPFKAMGSILMGDMGAAKRTPQFGSMYDDFLDAKGGGGGMKPRGGPDVAPSRGAGLGSLDEATKKPTALSDAVIKFQRWVQKAQRGLSTAAGAGADKFKTLYDEGLKLADDVVNLAKVTPGMGVVGQIVRVGFKKVIPGIAGVYMVSETIQDMMKIIKSDVPWLGDWKSLNSWKAEGMGQLLGGHGGTSLLAKGQEWLGLGTSIGDFQKQKWDKMQEVGALSSGKLMDLIIRGTTGIAGAGLQTFFPGLGTLAGTALYEGGRYATTGLNIPGITGTVGGDVNKYGEAEDFSDRIIAAIAAGFGQGVNQVEIR